MRLLSVRFDSRSSVVFNWKDSFALARNLARTLWDFSSSDTLEIFPQKNSRYISFVIFFLVICYDSDCQRPCVYLLELSWCNSSVRRKLFSAHKVTSRVHFDFSFLPEYCSRDRSGYSTRLIRSITESIRSDVTHSLHRVRAQSNNLRNRENRSHPLPSSSGSKGRYADKARIILHDYSELFLFPRCRPSSVEAARTNDLQDNSIERHGICAHAHVHTPAHKGVVERRRGVADDWSWLASIRRSMAARYRERDSTTSASDRLSAARFRSIGFDGLVRWRTTSTTKGDGSLARRPILDFDIRDSPMRNSRAHA